jgi:hypothetical protein
MEQLTRSFQVTIGGIDRTDTTVVEVHSRNDGVLRIDPHHFEVRFDPALVEPYALFRVQVISSIPEELDEARKWTLPEFVYRRYRPSPHAVRVRPAVQCFLFVQDERMLKMLECLNPVPAR